MARRSSGRRTDYSWTAAADIMTGIDLGAVAAFGPVATGLTQPGTIMRVRGTVGATLNAAAVQEFGLVHLGLIVVPADTFAAGVAPEFQTDGASSESGHWMWTGSIFLSSGFEAAIVNDQLSASIEIDSKAMRRFKPNDVVALVVENPAGAWNDQGGDVSVAYRYRTLLGL